MTDTIAGTEQSSAPKPAGQPVSKIEVSQSQELAGQPLGEQMNMPAQESAEGAAAMLQGASAPPDAPLGLSSSEVASRVAKGQVNADASVKTRSIKTIVLSNICTLFNLVNFILAVVVFTTGSYKNMLFMVVIVCNTVIGIVQEIRSKQSTDKLSIVAAGRVSVWRDGEKTAVALEELVLDDCIELGRGAQVPADCEVIGGSCEMNESLLTGESKLIKKAAGDSLMSGTFVNSGMVQARVTHVGEDNYANKISSEAKQHKDINSQIMTSLNGIIKYVSIIIFPLGIVLFAREYFTEHIAQNEAILSTVSALVGMIPEGLILLTSTVLAVAVVRLSKSQVLVQQLYCIETLARVDTLCLDKTGTITTGKMEVATIEEVPGCDISEVKQAFFSIASADKDPNDTALAILEYFKGNADQEDIAALECTRMIAFSSDRKYSGAQFASGKAYAMGAGEFVLGEGFSAVADQANKLAADARVLVIARVDSFTEEGKIEGTALPLGFVSIHDQIRDTAAQTISFFKEQGVDLKVISGDDPRTVSGIAQKVGIPHAENFVDAYSLTTPEEIAEAIATYSVFGRVKPEQKKAFVLALQDKGHTVAMTGDGVNDTLALKAADCGVAMASGSDAARNVAHLVLVNNDFASMPKVVAEGRRSINNLQRSASLFLVKTLLSLVLAIFFVLLPWEYPFQPIQMTLISSFTIGLPSFVLALEPNHDRIKGSFLKNVVVRSIPASLTVVLLVLCTNVAAYVFMGLDHAHVSSMCVLLTAWIGIQLIIRLSIPFTVVRAVLLAVVVTGTVLGATVLSGLFAIEAFSPDMALLSLIEAVCGALFFHLCYSFSEKRHEKELASMV